MSIEIVTSPKTGVTVSLASHYLFAGHRFCFTFDAIQKDSPAYESLVSAIEKENFRERISRRAAQKRESEKWDAVLSLLRKEKPASRPVFKFEGARLTDALKKSLIEKLEALASRMQSFVSADAPKVEKAETPESAQ